MPARDSYWPLWPLWLALVGVLALAALCHGDDRAVVRVPSHGASATVIWTSKRRSYLLGCAHAYDARGRATPHAIDVMGPPAPGNGFRLVAVDHRLDLSLVETGVGPLPVIPVAPQGHQVSRRLLSAGYDGMRIPKTRVWSDVIETQGARTYTRQAPTPGRSGGGLIDPAGPYLVGVCLAFESAYAGGPPTRGVYASHAAILDFLGRQRWSLGHVGNDHARRLELPPPAAWPDAGPACPPGGT